LNTERIDQLTGLKGKLDEKEDAYKIGFPHEVARASDSEASIDTSSPSTLVAPVKNRGLFSSIIGAVAELEAVEKCSASFALPAKPYQIVR
jgi:hypothetical protein